MASRTDAQTMTWDPNGATAGTGGSGTWDTTNSFWFNGTSLVPWMNGILDTAIFDGTAGTVTVAAPITAQSLTFGTSGYTISGDTLTLGVSGTPTISIGSGLSSTINSAIAGSNGLTVSGGGTLTLSGSGSNPFHSGPTTISDGATLVFASPTVASRVTSTSFFVNGASTLVFNAVARQDISGGTITFDATGGGTVDFSGTTINGGNVLFGNLVFTATGGIPNRVISSTGNGLNLNNFFNFRLNTASSDSSLVVDSFLWNRGSLTKTGPGIATLTFANEYDGVTSISGGTLATPLLADGGTASGIGNSSNAAGNLVLDGSTLQYTGVGASTNRLFTLTTNGAGIDASGTGPLTFSNPGALALSGAGTRTLMLTGSNTAANTLAAVLGDSGGATSLTKSGVGTWLLTGNQTYTGATTIAAGTLQLGSGGTSGSIVGDVTNNGTLAFNRSDIVNFGGDISGAGALVQLGSGTTILTGANTYTGATTIGAGTLQVGAGGETGTLPAGTVTNNAVLSFNRGDALTVANTIGGTGAINQMGTGVTTVSGSATASSTAVTAGTLLVDGTLTSPVAVDAAATLGGTGTIAGAATINSAGTLAPGRSAGTLTLGGLLLRAGSILEFELGTPDVVGGATNDLIQVNGDLTIEGTTLNVSDIGTFDTTAGSYRLISYTGSLTGNASNVTLGSLEGHLPADVEVQTSNPGFVNLIVAPNGVVTQFWDGAGLPSDGTIAGGSGVWNNTLANWTNAPGTINTSSSPGFDIFATTGGTVTLGEDVNMQGLQFTVGGYTIDGSGHTLTMTGLGGTGASPIRVDAGVSATSAAPIAGTAVRLLKEGDGTLVLTGNNSYDGGTTIATGTLQIGDGGTTGSIVGNVINHGTLVFNRSDSVTFAGAVSANGALRQAGTGTMVLTGANSYTGATTIAAGTLQIGDGGTTGAIGSGAIVTDNGALVVNKSNATLLTGDIIGTGSFTQAGAGVTVLTGKNTYSGGTTISGGTLQVGNGGLTGSLVGNVVNDSTLAFNRSDSSTIAGTISGSGALTKAGTGTLVLTGANTYTGATTVAAGSLQIGAGGTTGAIGSGAIINNGALIVNKSNATLLATGITGTGSFTQAGIGNTILIGANTYNGGTTISGGTLQIGNGGLTGSLVGNVVNDGTLAFNRSDSSTFAGAISGSGALTQAGTGATILAGPNTYIGGTTISAGTLQVGNGGVTGSLVGNVVNQGTLTFNRSDTSTFGGTISGSGALTKAGTGVLTLTGVNNYTGATTVSTATLRAGAENTFSASSAMIVLAGAIVDLDNFSQTVGSLAGTGNLTLGSGTLTTGDNTNTTFSGAISGAGGLIKNGTGFLRLSGTSNYTGATTLNAGLLQVTGAIGSTAVTVAGGATLAGTGSIAGPVVINGSLAPGIGAPGQLSTGNLTLNLAASGGFSAELNGTTPGTSYDRVVVTGTVTLAGSLTASLGFVPAIGQVFTIVDNDGIDAVSGTFVGLPQDATFAVGSTTMRISYVGGTGNDVTLTVGAVPTLSAVASPSVPLGGAVTNTATIAGGNAPTGSVTFNLYGPNDATCAGTPVFADTKTVSGNGSYVSSSFTPTALGVYRWTAGYSGDATNAAVPHGCNAPNQSVTIANSNQTITFAPLAPRRLSSLPFGVSATASSGLAVTFTSQTSGVCTVEGSTVTLVAVGTCTVAADQAGNTSYTAAPQVAQSFIVAADRRLVVGAASGASTVRSFDIASGIVRSEISDFGTFTGGTAVAQGDVDGNGVIDVVAAAGPGGSPRVMVFDGHSSIARLSFFAFDPAYQGGVEIAAGDVTGDGVPELLVVGGCDAPAEVRAFDGRTGARVRTYALTLPSFSCGLHVAAGDVNGDGIAELAVGAGPGASFVTVIDGVTGSVIRELYPFSPAFGGGVSVAAGDVNGDGFADLVTGAGPGGTPHVRVFDGTTGSQIAGTIGSFHAYTALFGGGVRVGAGDLTGDGRAEVITGAGPGGGPHVRVWDGVSGTEIYGLYVFDPSFSGGVSVAGPTQAGRMNVDIAERTAGTDIRIAGWALREIAVDTIGTDAIHAWAYPIDGTTPVFVGAATERVPRPDVAAAFGAEFLMAGFDFGGTLAAGTYDLVVFARNVRTLQFDQARVVRVTVP